MQQRQPRRQGRTSGPAVPRLRSTTRCGEAMTDSSRWSRRPTGESCAGTGPNLPEAAIRVQAEAVAADLAGAARPVAQGLHPAPGAGRRRRGRRGRLGRPAGHHPGRVRRAGDHQPHAGRGLPARRHGRAVGGRAARRPQLPQRAPQHRRAGRRAAAPATTGSACTRRWRRWSRSGRPARWPRCTRSPRRTPAAATSRRRTAWSGAPRRPRCTPAGSTGCWRSWARAPRSAPSPRVRRCPARWSGGESKLVLQGIRDFDLQGGSGMRDKTLTALKALYTGVGDHPLAARRPRR